MNLSVDINETLSRSQVETISLSVSLAIIIALSLCGNFLLILAFIRNNRLRSSFANKLIMSLSIIDFLTAAFPLSYQLSTVIDYRLISKGGLLCEVGGIASYSFFFTSIFALVMLSVDRFIALGYPLRYNQRLKQPTKVFMIFYPYFHGIFFAVYCSICLEIKYHTNGFDCGLSWSTLSITFNLTMLMIYLGVPLTCLVVLNTLTLVLVRRQNRRILDYGLRDVQNASRNKAQEFFHRRAAVESKLAKVSIVIIFVFLLCWTPYAVTRALESLAFDLSSATMSGSVWTAHASTFVNPMIYSSLRADLRREMFKICCCFKRRRGRPVVNYNLRVVTLGIGGTLSNSRCPSTSGTGLTLIPE